jgi:hypothetical protein
VNLFTVNRLDAEGVYVRLVFQNQLFQVKERLFVYTTLPHLDLSNRVKLLLLTYKFKKIYLALPVIFGLRTMADFAHLRSDGIFDHENLLQEDIGERLRLHGQLHFETL